MKSHKRRRTLIKPTTKPMTIPFTGTPQTCSFLFQFSSSLSFSHHLSERRNATGDWQRSSWGATLSASDIRWRDVFMTFALFLHPFIRISHSHRTTQGVSVSVEPLTFSEYPRYCMYRMRACSRFSTWSMPWTVRVFVLGNAHADSRSCTGVRP